MCAGVVLHYQLRQRGKTMPEDHSCEEFDGECYGWGWHAVELKDDDLFSPSELAQVKVIREDSVKYSYDTYTWEV